MESNDDISFLLIHFQLALEKGNLSKKIAVISDATHTQSKLIETRVNMILPTFDAVELFNGLSMSSEDLLGFDMIISTYSIDITSIPSITVSPFISDLDIKRINRVYYQNFIKQKKSEYSNLLSAVDSDTILLKQNFKNKMEVLSCINEILLAKQCVTEQYYDSLVKREMESSTELNNAIAIPHGSYNFVISPKVVVISLDKPIQWGEESVSLIISLAIDFKDNAKCLSIVKDVYSLMNSTSIINRILLANNTIDFMKCLT